MSENSRQIHRYFEIYKAGTNFRNFIFLIKFIFIIIHGLGIVLIFLMNSTLNTKRFISVSINI